MLESIYLPNTSLLSRSLHLNMEFTRRQTLNFGSNETLNIQIRQAAPDNSASEGHVSGGQFQILFSVGYPAEESECVVLKHV